MPIVKLYANLRRVAGVKEISVPAASLETLLSALVTEIPALESHLFEDEQLRRYVIITINGHHVTALDTLLAEGDQIAIFPPIAGG